jgi:hypothetical protein
MFFGSYFLLLLVFLRGLSESLRRSGCIQYRHAYQSYKMGYPAFQGNLILNNREKITGYILSDKTDQFKSKDDEGSLKSF